MCAGGSHASKPRVKFILKIFPKLPREKFKNTYCAADLAESKEPNAAISQDRNTLPSQVFSVSAFLLCGDFAATPRKRQHRGHREKRR